MGAAAAVSCLPGALIIGSRLLGRDGVDLCIMHRMTGYWCPLCGGTRATRALMHGDLTAACGYNPFALMVLALGAAVLVRWLISRRRGAPRPLLTAREAVVIFAVAGLFAVARNLPGMWVYLNPLLGPTG
ncbi:DUF2752 domain-containing protein [Actinomyces ruminicola]|uniref:DUF2752 domain-containing protein n=1 Tax=Actinomyces ruminicola TaxID=332524 RepID=A0A1G9UDP2_9ACTO|nr:DUF2752 domain-containing protein [Actinomyces ruminicola]SDM58081.1 Protein of unknown function [Actinomyces ruminicola]